MLGDSLANDFLLDSLKFQGLGPRVFIGPLAGNLHLTIRDELLNAR
jgi:hypothetical protein